ncbi:MAG: FAD-dependent oxidoreductase [Proteobacteria bacterium]|nr:FAD-dependent oxidoreductase [Pseudomonadota bacterium]
MLKYLFKPIRIGAMEVRNRIVLPPMTLSYGMADGTVSERLRDYYEARAKGGAGLIIAEAAGIHPDRKYGLFPLGLYNDAQVESWSQVARVVHSRGAKLAVQIMDPGPEGIKMLTGIQPVGPSAVVGRGLFRDVPRELSVGEIEAMIEDFSGAAHRAKEAGLDAVEIHAAHGYALVGSFLSPFSNKRTDSYGGSLEGRLRFLLEIIKAIRKRVGQDFPIIVRISGEERRTGGRTFQESQFIARILVDTGVDALEISGGTVPTVMWAVVPPSGTPLALNAPFAEAIKQVVDVPVICVGRINSPQIAEFVLEAGKADLVSMGRALHADPELPNKAAAGRFEDIVPCVACNCGCIGKVQQGQQATCTVNPAAGREKEMVIVPTEKPKKVLVAGGGPAGLEAARVAALRGHTVTLCEKKEKLGGQVNLASVPPFMQEISQLIKYLSLQVQKAGVKVILGQEVTPELIDKIRPDVVIVATGASPLVPKNIPGTDKGTVVTAWDVLGGHEAGTARKAVIIGGNLTGCETADFLAQPSDNLMAAPTDVTILEMRDAVALDSMAEPRHLLLDRLREKRVQIQLRAEVKEILDDGVVFVRDGQEESVHGAEYVILAMGAIPVDNLSTEIKGRVAETYVIGDASEPRRTLEAITEAAEIARKI